MKKLKIRRSIIIAIAFLIVSLVVFNTFTGMKAEPEQGSSVQAHPLVNILEVEYANSTTSLNFTGRLNASNKIDLYTEVNGRLLRAEKPFKDGSRFKQGEVLLQLNNRDAVMQLRSSRSAFQSLLTQLQADLATDYPDNFKNWNAYIKAFNPENNLTDLPEISNQKEKNFLIARNVYNQYYAIQSQEAQVAKYTLTAPFQGALHKTNLSPGNLVRAGQTIGQLVGSNSFELEIGVSPNDIAKVSLGDKAVLTSDQVTGKWDGKVVRIGKALDAKTQSIKVYVAVQSEVLAEGMYMEAQLYGKDVTGSTHIPAKLVIDNSYVFAIENDSVLVKKQVQVINENNDEVQVAGLPPGTILLNQALLGAEEGGIVRVQK